MLKKVRLKEKDDYQTLFVASRVTPMLEALLEGRPGPVAVGSEQGGIPCWDDLVVLGTDRSLHHVQVKRQATAFSNTAIKRPNADSRMSELDETLASLADWAGAAANLTSTRTFEIALLTPTVEVKKDLPIRWLEHICNDCSKTGVDCDELAKRTDGPTLKVFEWLTSWCRFKDWSHVVSALSRVSVSYPGNETNLREQITTSLARNFTDPPRVLDLLVAYVGREGNDVSQIAAENVFAHLHDFANPELITWTQYHLESHMTGWAVCGTNGIPANDDEPPSPVVARLWDHAGATRKLRVSGPCQHNDAAPHSLPAALLRLALHIQGPSQVLVSNDGDWRNSARHASGHTLGVGDDDFDHLCWMPNTRSMAPSRQRVVKGAEAIRQEAIDLTTAMDEMTWKQVLQKMEDRLGTVRDGDLSHEMRKVWDDLREKLADDPAHRANLFARMMYPPGEALNSNHTLRVGPKSVALIANAFLLLVLVAVGLECTDISCERLGDIGAIQAIATQRWSGPRGQEGVSELDSHGLTALMNNNVSPVVILSGLSTSPTEVLDTSLAAEPSDTTSIAAARTPKLLVTKSIVVRRLLKDGTLESVRRHFGSQIGKSITARNEAIRFDIRQ